MNLQNFVRVDLAVAVDAAATTLVINDPVAPFNAPFDPASGIATVVLVDNEWNPTEFEIVSYEDAADNGDGTWTLSGVSRGQEGTTAVAWGAGAIVTQPLTAGAMSKFHVLDGKVGIGLSDPDAPLDVNGAIRASYKSLGYGSIGIIPGWAANRTGYIEWRDGLGVRYGYMGGDVDEVALHLENSADFVVAGGNVGIGVFEPSSRLVVDGDAEFRRAGQPATGQLWKLTSDAVANRLTSQFDVGNSKACIFDQVNSSASSYYSWRFDGSPRLTMWHGGLIDMQGRVEVVAGTLRALDFKDSTNQLISFSGATATQLGVRSWSTTALWHGNCADMGGGSPKTVKYTADYSYPTSIQQLGASGDIDFCNINALGDVGASANLQTNMRIARNGNVGIGTGVSAPLARLQVGGGSLCITGWNGGGVAVPALEMGYYSPVSRSLIRTYGTTAGTGNIGIGANAHLSTCQLFLQASGGFVGIGTASPSYRLHVVGDIYATGNIISASDIRFKTKIEGIADPIEKVKKLQGFTYQKKHDEEGRRLVGVSAQDVRKVLPEAVTEDKDGKLAVAYGNMNALLIEAIKDQQKMIEALESRLHEVEALLAL